MKIEKIIPDTSVIIEGILSKRLENKELEVGEIILHEAVLAELEHQANQSRVTGIMGLDEINKIKTFSSTKVRFAGNRPRASEIKYASLGEIDALIRQLAYEEDATLMTADRVQSEVAKAKGIKVIFIESIKKKTKLKLSKFFDEQTMSVHLRENVSAVAKKGMPGNWEFVQLTHKKLKQLEIKSIAREIIEEAKKRSDGFIEIERAGSTIVQLGRYRIVITQPPFSDGHEITAVRPVKKLSLEDYELSEKLTKRISEQAEGILVAGSPGMGKSTFVQGLAEFYANQEKIVKTVEAPRDLVLDDNITQYAISHGSGEEIHDILLLTRPDYTLFDEMRNTKDFQLFADMRLAGVGMVGVVHATNPIDAIQRFIGRVEMGVIPQIIDTVIFIKNGRVESVLNLEMTVKVPSGMTEADLARPVVVVNDFETNTLKYEIYSYGEQTVVIPVKESLTQEQKGANKLAESSIKRVIQRYADNAEIEILSNNKCLVKVPKRFIAKMIGKQGQNINKIEKELGIGINVEELESKEIKPEGESVNFDFDVGKKSLSIFLDPKLKDQEFDILTSGKVLLSAKSSKKSVIKIKKTNLGKALADALVQGETVEVRLL